jgi:hypothetical protein
MPYKCRRAGFSEGEMYAQHLGQWPPTRSPPPLCTQPAGGMTKAEGDWMTRRSKAEAVCVCGARPHVKPMPGRRVFPPSLWLAHPPILHSAAKGNARPAACCVACWVG